MSKDIELLREFGYEIGLKKIGHEKGYCFDKYEMGKRIYCKEKRYEVEAMALIFYEDNYYLMCFSFKYDGIINYRVDRMEGVPIESESISSKAIMDDSDIAKFIEQAFKMYGGPVTDVTIKFQDSLMGDVQNKFGEHVHIVRTSPEKYVVSVQPQVSPTFWGWIFQFGKKMKILSPDSLVDAFKNKAAELVE